MGLAGHSTTHAYVDAGNVLNGVSRTVYGGRTGVGQRTHCGGCCCLWVHLIDHGYRVDHRCDPGRHLQTERRSLARQAFAPRFCGLRQFAYLYVSCTRALLYLVVGANWRRNRWLCHRCGHHMGTKTCAPGKNGARHGGGDVCRPRAISHF